MVKLYDHSLRKSSEMVCINSRLKCSLGLYKSKRRLVGLRYLFSFSQRLIAFCRQVRRVASGFFFRSKSISRFTTDRSPPTLRSRSSNNVASLNAPLNNSSATCGFPRTFLCMASTHRANLLFGRNLGRVRLTGHVHCSVREFDSLSKSCPQGIYFLAG